MDPNEALDMLTDALECEDADAFRDAAEALETWLGRGGFAPDWSRVNPDTVEAFDLYRTTGELPTFCYTDEPEAL